jgi:hypothetical protein
MAASRADIVLHAGCGVGFYLGTIARRTGLLADGFDISIPAVDAAAARRKSMMRRPVRWRCGPKWLPLAPLNALAIAGVVG